MQFGLLFSFYAGLGIFEFDLLYLSTQASLIRTNTVAFCENKLQYQLTRMLSNGMPRAVASTSNSESSSEAVVLNNNFLYTTLEQFFDKWW